MYQLVSASLTGVSQPQGWAQVLTHPQQRFICAVALQGEQAHQLGHDLTEHFFASQLHTALELHQFVEQLQQRCQDADVLLQCAAQLLTEETSVICSYQGFVYLRRMNKIGLILPVQDTIQIVEGKTHADDIYVLGTAAATPYDQAIQQILNTVQEPEAFVTQLMKHVLQTADSSLVAVTYLQ